MPCLKLHIIIINAIITYYVMQVWRKRHFMLKGRELWYEKGDRGVSIVFFVAYCIVYVCFVVKNLRINVHMTDLKTVQER